MELFGTQVLSCYFKYSKNFGVIIGKGSETKYCIGIQHINNNNKSFIAS